MPDELLKKNAIICIMRYDYRGQMYGMRKHVNPLQGLMKFNSDEVPAKVRLGGFKAL